MGEHERMSAEAAIQATDARSGTPMTSWPAAVAPAAEKHRSAESNIDRIWSQSPVGAVPVVDRMDLGSELIIYGHSDILADGNTFVAEFDDRSVVIKEATPLGAGRFRVVATPTASGPIEGYLALYPKGSEHENDFLINITVDAEASSADSPGADRPLKLSEAVDQLGTATAELYEGRLQAITTFASELAVKDVHETSLPTVMLRAALGIAVGAASAGIGVYIAESAMVLMAASGEVATEVIKVLAEETISGAVEYGIDVATSTAETFDHADSNGVHVTPISAFIAGQSAALSDLKRSRTDAAKVQGSRRANSLEGSDPGSGYLLLRHLRQAILDNRKAAVSTQFVSTLQAWFVGQARASLGVTDPDARVPVGTSATPDPATDMTREGNLGNNIGHIGPHTNGVLRVRLGAGPDGSGLFFIESASVTGVDSQILVDNLPKTISELDMPVTATHIREQDRSLFTVARNEAGALFASSSAEFSKTRFDPGEGPADRAFLRSQTRTTNDEEAARKIFQQIGLQHFHAKVG